MYFEASFGVIPTRRAAPAKEPVSTADTKTRMDRAVEAAKEDFSTVRTGRANPQLFQKVMVEYYGAATPLQQLWPITK